MIAQAWACGRGIGACWIALALAACVGESGAGKTGETGAVSVDLDCTGPLSDWTGPAPSSVDDALQCPSGGYTYYPATQQACGDGTLVSCAGIPYSVSYRYDGSGALISVLYCSDVDEFCNDRSACIAYGDFSC